MNKIKVLLVMVLLLFYFASLDNVFADEPTEVVTTEEVIDEVAVEYELTLPEISEETINQAKTWVVGALISLLTIMMSSLVSGLILSKLKADAVSKFDEAVQKGVLSQDKADKAILEMNNAEQIIKNKLDTFSEKIGSKLNEFTLKIEGLDGKVDKMNIFFERLFEGLETYLEEDNPEDNEEEV